MTGSEIMIILENEAKYLNVPYGIIGLKENLSIQECETDIDDFPYEFSIGVYEYKTYPDKEFSDDEFIHSVVGMAHEVCGHGSQVYYEFDKNTPLSNILALNHYACHESSAYYGFLEKYPTAREQRQAKEPLPVQLIPTSRYYKQPHETAAEYAGVYHAYNFLSNEFGKEKANDLICHYVSNHDLTEFIQTNKTYTSVQDALTDFNITFQKNAINQRQYVNGSGSIGILEHLDKKLFRDNRNFKAEINSCLNGIEQDYKMVAAFIKSAEEKNDIERARSLFHVKALIPFDLTFEIAFGEPFQTPDLNIKVSEASVYKLKNELKPELVLNPEDLDFADKQHPPEL